MKWNFFPDNKSQKKWPFLRKSEDGRFKKEWNNNSFRKIAVFEESREWGRKSLQLDQALSLWSGSTDSKSLDYQRTNPREYQIWELTQKKPLEYKTQKNKQTNENSAQISPYRKLTQTTGPTWGGQKPKGRKISTFFKERIQLSLKPGKRRLQIIS